MTDGLLVELRQKTVQLLEAIDSGSDGAWDYGEIVGHHPEGPDQIVPPPGSAPSELESQGAGAKYSAENLGRADSARGEDHEHDWRAYYGRGIPGQLPDFMVCDQCGARRPYGEDSSPVDDTVRLRTALRYLAYGLEAMADGTVRVLQDPPAITADGLLEARAAIDAGKPEATDER